MGDGSTRKKGFADQNDEEIELVKKHCEWIKKLFLSKIQRLILRDMNCDKYSYADNMTHHCLMNASKLAQELVYKICEIGYGDEDAKVDREWQGKTKLESQ